MEESKMNNGKLKTLFGILLLVDFALVPIALIVLIVTFIVTF